MENYEAIVGTLALTMGASWASGINLYAALLMLGLGGAMGNFDLPPDLEVLSNPIVIGAAGLMYLVEFFTDKIPGVDTAWDGLHTFIRIPAGAMLAAGAVGDVGPAMEIASGILGGGMAATSHFTKAGTRALINTSPEPFTNWGASITEDVGVFGGLWVALNHPVVFLVLLFVFLLLVIWLMPKIWRMLVVIFRKIGGWLGLVNKEPAVATAPGQGPAVATAPGQPPPAPSPGNASEDLVKQLETLKQLHDAGSLSDEEFRQAKDRLLKS